jgi:hypothetical protein
MTCATSKLTNDHHVYPLINIHYNNKTFLNGEKLEDIIEPSRVQLDW